MKAERLITEDDSQVIVRSLSDPQAFGEIFERHFDKILRYLQRRVGTDDGEDLAAQVFLTAFDKRHTFDCSNHHAETWLYGIATNLIRHHARKEIARLRILSHVPPERYETESDVSYRLDAQRAGRKLAGALASLPRTQRDVVTLSAIEGLSDREIATVLGVPSGTVRSWLSRARAELRNQLHEIAPRC